MKNKLVMIEPMAKLIQPTKWAKKGLADFKIDLTGLCGFGCTYCSSNTNPFHSWNKHTFATEVREQLGVEASPTTDPELTYVFRGNIVEQLRAELAGRPKSFGKGKTLAFGCLTDNLAPYLIQRRDPETPSIAEQCLVMLLEQTSFRIRILTKNAAVANRRGVELLEPWKHRVVVGLSIGTLDPEWARRVEKGTSSPAKRIAATRALQDAGIPTFGMLCPVFPGAVQDVDAILDGIRPERVETVWAEPYNDRSNWRNVVGSAATEADLARMFGEDRDPKAWSDYAVGLYKKLRLRADAEGWTDKLAYMLYEASMEASYARTFSDLRGVLLQSIDKMGRSKHPVFAALQDRLKMSVWDIVGSDYE